VPAFDATQPGNIGSYPMAVGSEPPLKQSVVKGGTISPFTLPITLPQAAGNTVTVAPAIISGVTSVCGVVDSTGSADPANFGITCGATATSSTLTVNLAIAADSAAARSATARSRDRHKTALLAALAMGFPAIVFLSVGASAFAPRSRKRGLNRFVSILGILLVLALLVILPACGGGFHATFVTSNTNTYTLTIMAFVTDSTGVVGVDVFTVPLTVN